MEKEIEEFYLDKNRKFGNSPKGVGWDDEKRAESRYEFVANIIPKGSEVLEYGFGNGIFRHHVSSKSKKYIGVEPMKCYYEKVHSKENEFLYNTSIEHFTSEFNNKDLTFNTIGKHDWSFTVGVFALKLGITEQEYRRFCYTSIINMLHVAEKGIVLNAFQDAVDFKDSEQFYFNLNHLLSFLKEMGYTRYDLFNKPSNTPFEFYLKIYK